MMESVITQIVCLLDSYRKLLDSFVIVSFDRGWILVSFFWCKDVLRNCFGIFLELVQLYQPGCSE